MPSEEIVESIKRTSAQRQSLWERWQRVYEQMDIDLNPEKDPFESKASMHVTKMGRYLISQMEKEAGQARTKHIQDHGITRLKAAHEPDAALIALYVTAIFSSAISTGCGCAPAAFAITGASAAACQAASQGIQGVFGQGSQNMASLLQSRSQGEIALINHELQEDQRIREMHQTEQRNHQNLAQSSDEHERKDEQSRHEAMKAVLQ